jgi:hypothetical protein
MTPNTHLDEIRIAEAATKHADQLLNQYLHSGFLAPSKADIKAYGETFKALSERVLAMLAEKAAAEARATRAEAFAVQILRLLASIWFYGGFNAETPNEARLRLIMKQQGFWPVTTEAALFRLLDEPAALATTQDPRS